MVGSVFGIGAVVLAWEAVDVGSGRGAGRDGAIHRRVLFSEKTFHTSLARDFTTAMRLGSVHLYTNYVTSGRDEQSKPLDTLLHAMILTKGKITS